MKKVTALSIIFLVTSNILAVTNYVSKTGNHISPFDSWVNAATNIQAAVNAAAVGDMVLVNDGTYYPGNQISITKDIIVKSVNRAEKTIVNGGFPAQTNRCFNISNGMIDGFTITNGSTQGLSYDAGGGVLCYGGVAQNCIITGNRSGDNGGGVYCSHGGIVRNCIISKNYTSGSGGGVYCDFVGTLENCIVKNNNSGRSGGGFYCYGCNVKNCLVIDNFAEGGGGGMMISYSVNAENCTVVGNSAFKIWEVVWGSLTDEYAGGVYCYGDGSSIQNSILWSNRNGNRFSDESKNLYNCIENWTNIVNGIITNNPKFRDVAAGNYRLEEFSPCRNAGTNMSWMLTAKDLDGNPRITGGRVDMGAYEFIPEPCLFFIVLIPLFLRGLGGFN